MRVAIAALLVLATLAAITPNATAQISTPLNPSGIANSGLTPAVDVEGSTIGIAHYTAGGQLVFTYSINGGTTWTDRFVTGASGLTTSRRLDVTIDDASHFNVWRMTDNCAGSMVRYRSLDSGFSWTSITDTNGLNGALANTGGSTSCSSTGSGVFYKWVDTASFENLGSNAVQWYMGRTLGTFTSAGDSLTYCGGAVMRYYDGVTFTTILTRTGTCRQGQSGGGWTFTGGASKMTDTNTAQVVTWDSSNTARLYRRVSGAWDGGVNLDDTGNPLPSRSGPVAIFEMGGPYMFGAQVPTAMYAAEFVGVSSFATHYMTLLGSTVADSGKSGNRLGVLMQESTEFPVAIYHSCDAGDSWARLQLTSFDAYPANPRMTPTVSGGFGVVATTNTGLSWQTTVDATCATSGTGGSGGSSGSFSIQEIFCSDRHDEAGKFGYNYREDVNSFDANVFQDPNIDHGFEFVGNTNDYAYLAKTFTPATASTGMRVIFRIEASADAATTVFRVGFSLENHVTSGWQNGDTTLTNAAKGDGGDPGTLPATGAFFNWIEVRFEERNNDWYARVFYYNQGDRYQIGGSDLFDNPNTATYYSFEVDTSATHPYYKMRRMVKNADDSAYVAESIGGTGTPFERDLTAAANPTNPSNIFGDIADAPLYSQWFVGGAVALGNAHTLLDDGNQEATSPSTCIYDLYGQAVVDGSVGATGPATNPNGDAYIPPATDTDASGTGAADSDGLFEVSGRKAIYYSAALILAFLFVGYRFTAGNRKRNDSE